jgi:hypothetical protein
MEKLSSFGDLNKIKGQFPVSPEEEKDIVNVAINKKSLEENFLANKKEKELMPEIGAIISGVTQDQSIASWCNDNGIFWTRISNQYKRDETWAAVTNSGYGGKGLIVYLDKEPRSGNKIKITSIHEKTARGIVI